MRLELPFQSYRHLSRPVSSVRLVNCYPEPAPIGGKAPVLLRSSPGVKSRFTVGSGPYRGRERFQGQLHVVSGTKLYRVSSNGTTAVLGTIPGTAPVRMASNGIQLVIVTNPDAYVWDGTTLAQITDPDFTSRGAFDCQFFDSFVLFLEPNSGRFFGSDLLDATQYDSLAFATAEGAPDDLVGFIVDHRQAILGGTETCELWSNVGGSGFPFARFDNGFIEAGCGAGKSFAKADNSVLWLDNYYIVRKLDGLNPVRISTSAVEQAFSRYTHPESAFAYTFVHQGHWFYAIVVPGEASWLYDLSTQEWHERATFGQVDWRVQDVINIFGKTLAFSETNLVGELDEDTYSEWGATQRMEWTYPTVYADGRRAFHKSLEIIMETGVGLTTGQGSAPEIGLDISDDGGITFTPHINRSIGAIGKYRQRVTWYGLGSSENRVYRPWISDPVRRTIIDTQLEVTGGRL